MTTQTVSIQVTRLQHCITELRSKGIDIDHVHLPDDPCHGPRVYVQPSNRLAAMPGAIYKTQGDANGRIEHHSIPLGGCQVRWQQRA